MKNISIARSISASGISGFVTWSFISLLPILFSSLSAFRGEQPSGGVPSQRSGPGVARLWDDAEGIGWQSGGRSPERGPLVFFLAEKFARKAEDRRDDSRQRNPEDEPGFLCPTARRAAR